MFQDIDPNAPNYSAKVSRPPVNPDRVMMELFVLALRDRKASRALSFFGNGGNLTDKDF